MDSELRHQLMETMLRLKRIAPRPHSKVQFHEMMILRCLEPGENADFCVGFPDVHKHLRVSKPAVSQMMNSLENKGYICREIDTRDRRKISVTLTDSGRSAIRGMKCQFDDMMNEVCDRMGAEDLRQLIVLVNRFADVMDEVNKSSNFRQDREDSEI